MRLNSQKGYSLIEVGVGLVLITIFLICGVTMLKGTYNTYRLIEKKNIAMSYLIKGTENALITGTIIPITDDASGTVTEIKEENGQRIKTSTTNLSTYNMTLITKIETLPSKNGKDYIDSKVKLVTSTVEFYLNANNPDSKRTMVLKTLKVEGD